jgi:rare lipoprotein A
MIAMTAVVIRRSESRRRAKTARICARTARIQAIAAAKYTPMVVCVFSLLATTVAQARPHSDRASFYSSGRVTASGEKFDKAALKAAHPSLPFGSIVKVVNKRNGKSVVVEINDRAPAKWTRRTIDLTPGAARAIGVIKRGVVPVHLEVAQVTRPQLNRAFVKLARLLEAKQAQTAAATNPEDPAPPVVEAQQAQTAASTNAEAPAPPVGQQFQLASAVATEVTRPLGFVGNVFQKYMESVVKSAGPHVRLTCANGRPLPEPLRAVLRRAAWEFNSVVEVISGYRSAAYNRALYGNRSKGNGVYVGDASQHIRCRAADIRIARVSLDRLHAWALRQPELGGVGRYRSNFIHVDIRPRLHGRVVTWDWRGGRKFARRHHQRQQARIGA